MEVASKFIPINNWSLGTFILFSDVCVDQSFDLSHCQILSEQKNNGNECGVRPLCCSPFLLFLISKLCVNMYFTC